MSNRRASTFALPPGLASIIRGKALFVGETKTMSFGQTMNQLLSGERGAGSREQGAGSQTQDPRPKTQDPIVWQRGDKYARGAILQEVSAETPSGPARISTTQPPSLLASTSAALPPSPAAAKKPVTLDLIIEQYRLAVRVTTQRHLYCGRLVSHWIRRQPERPAAEQLPRAAAIMVIERRIKAEGLDGCRPNRDLRCYQASRLFGGDAEKLAISAIREITRLIERVTELQGERWRILPAHCDAARELWAKMLDGKMTREMIKAEVDRILPRPAVKPAPSMSRQMQTVLRILPGMSEGEWSAIRIALIRLAREAKARGGRPAAA
jgi:hypothetical protein